MSELDSTYVPSVPNQVRCPPHITQSEDKPPRACKLCGCRVYDAYMLSNLFAVMAGKTDMLRGRD